MLRRFVTEVHHELRLVEPEGLDLTAPAAEDGTAAQTRDQTGKYRPAVTRDRPSAAVPAPQRYGFILVRVRSIADGVMEVGMKFKGGGVTSPLATGQTMVVNGIQVEAVAVGTGRRS